MPIRRAILVLLVCLAVSAKAETITVSAAISLKDVMGEIGSGWQAADGDTVQFNFGASGLLAAQIAQGAPADAFISAGATEMDQLALQNLIDSAGRRNVCSNELVLIVPADAAFIPQSFADLGDRRVGRVAAGQPSIVPAGRYARQVLERLKLWAAVEPKLVFGENVRQVLDFVERGEVDAGIVYATDAASAGGKVRVAATADPATHDPIVYPAAVIKQSAHAAAAGRFLDYLSTPAARRVLEAHGFIVTVPTTAPSP